MASVAWKGGGQMNRAAIDPGLSGGIAWTDPDGLPRCCRMPTGEGELVDLLRSLAVQPGGLEVFIEDVPWVVGARVSPASVAKLHRNAGFLLGALAALGVRVVLVKPADWQRHFRLGTRREHGTRWKAKLRDEAQRRFPGLEVTLATADALLLLDFGKERHE